MVSVIPPRRYAQPVTQPRRIRRAGSSGSAGSSAAVPGAVLVVHPGAAAPGRAGLRDAGGAAPLTTSRLGVDRLVQVGRMTRPSALLTILGDHHDVAVGRARRRVRDQAG